MAREWQEEAKRAYDRKFTDAIGSRGHLRECNRSALEKHVKTVTMRADSLAFNEADFFQTLIERQEETIRRTQHTVRPSCASPAPRSGDRVHRCWNLSLRGIPAHDSSTAPTVVAAKTASHRHRASPDQYRHSGRVAG